ncbi:hypothetical protein PB2503_06657 [Parvularcula bermudensis HTCC2503]|uniref:Major facilitator superfamily (MFS) profile domain-containing protein n=1 Tax=Parvularcula bermudensis (strain ATCC BAA-594 / HTCC2503 / KCTC 12087) TaxID=314260 RepID=E0TI58_PARBH|nr:MFS transporter [Parvularcula bermudensis]ADM09397.1 hypothetical protein PB2503_06657 [Parvularcula bermudensis HTCC2503]
MTTTASTASFSRRFWPLFGAQTFGAFADNTLRQATIIAVYSAALAGADAEAFLLPGGLGIYAGGVVSVMFTLPVFLFSPLSGQLADIVPRHQLVRLLKGIELILMAMAALAFALGNGLFLISCLFLMGSQSAFFSPVRNALMPDYYPGRALHRANGYYNAALFVAIIAGIGIGGYFVGQDGGRTIVSCILVAAALSGLLLALFCPKVPAPANRKIDFNIPIVAIRLFAEVRRLDGVLFPMIGVGWYWLVGAMTLAFLPNFVNDTLGGDEAAITTTLVVSLIGAGFGSIAAGVISGRMTRPFLLSAAGLLITIICSLMIWIVTADFDMPPEGLLSPSNSVLLLALIFFSVGNAFFMIPLLAAVQSRAPDGRRAKIMGAANMTYGAFSTLGGVMVIPILAAGIDARDLFLVLIIAQAIVLGIMVFLGRRLPAGERPPFSGEVITPHFEDGA